MTGPHDNGREEKVRNALRHYYDQRLYSAQYGGEPALTFERSAVARIFEAFARDDESRKAGICHWCGGPIL